MATTDPNWLYSSTAQSGAALVAIMGGYLLTRVISTTSERATIDAELERLRDQRALKQEDLDEHQRDIDWREANDIVQEAWEDIIGDEMPTVDFLVTTHMVEGSRAGLQRDIADLLSRVADAKNMVDQVIIDYYESTRGFPADYEDLWAEHEEPDQNHAGYAERYYDSRREGWLGQFRERDKRAREHQQAHMSAVDRMLGQSSMGYLGRIPMMTDLPRIKPITIFHEQAEAAQLATTLRRRNDLRYTLAGIDREMDALTRRRAGLVIPHGTKYGFVALAIFAVTGVIFPLVVLVAHRAEGDPLLDWLVLGGFVLGLGLVMHYTWLSLFRSDQKRGDSGSSEGTPERE